MEKRAADTSSRVAQATVLELKTSGRVDKRRCLDVHHYRGSVRTNASESRQFERRHNTVSRFSCNVKELHTPRLKQFIDPQRMSFVDRGSLKEQQGPMPLIHVPKYRDTTKAK